MEIVKFTGPFDVATLVVEKSPRLSMVCLKINESDVHLNKWQALALAAVLKDYAGQMEG